MKISVDKEIQKQQADLGVLGGGLFLDLAPDAIPVDGWSGGYNFIKSDTGLIKPRLGRSEWANLADEFDPLPLPADTFIYAIGENREGTAAGITSTLLVFIGNQIARYSGTWAWVLDPTGTFDIVVIPGKWVFRRMKGYIAAAEHQFLACANQEEELLFINESGTTFRPDTGTGALTVGYAYGQLKPKWMEIYQGRMFIAGGNDEPGALWCSRSGDCYDWTYTTPDPDNSDAQMIRVGWSDEDEITGLYTYMNLLFIFMTNSIWYLDASGSNPQTDWELKQFTSRVGCLSGHSIQDIGNDLLYISNDYKARTLRGTERFGDLDLGSVSTGRVDSLLAGKDYDWCDSVLVPNKGWYMLSLSSSSDLVSDVMLIYDYGDASGGEEGGPAPWYRMEPVWRYSAPNEYVANPRTCFCRSRAAGSGGLEVTLCGGANGIIYTEFSQSSYEDLDTSETEPIIAWLTGKHMVTPDNTDVVLEKVTTIIKYLQVPADGVASALSLGAILNPLTNAVTKTINIDVTENLDIYAYWDLSVWDTAFWDAGVDVEAVAPIEERGSSFCLYISASEIDVEFYRMFVYVRPEVT